MIAWGFYLFILYIQAMASLSCSNGFRPGVMIAVCRSSHVVSNRPPRYETLKVCSIFCGESIPHNHDPTPTSLNPCHLPTYSGNRKFIPSNNVFTFLHPSLVYQIPREWNATWNLLQVSAHTRLGVPEIFFCACRGIVRLAVRTSPCAKQENPLHAKK